MATNNVIVNNLCAWPLYFKRVSGTGYGDIKLPANAKNFALLTFEEVQAQIQMGNVMFTGDDGMGSHARIEIVDDTVRKQLFGIDGVETENPTILNLDTVKALLAIKTKQKFNSRLEELIATNAEKKMLLTLAEQAGVENAESWKFEAIKAVAETADL